MQTRREVALAGAAAVLGAGFKPAAALAGAPSPVQPFGLVVCDGALRSARAFSAEASARGATVALGDRDIEQLWRDRIRPLWRQAPVAVAGLTRPGLAHCFELVAAREGARLVYWAEHDDSLVGAMHAVFPRTEGRAARLTRAAAQWPAAAFDLMALAPCTATAGLETERAAASRACGAAPLAVSWIIAPTRRSVG